MKKTFIPLAILTVSLLASTTVLPAPPALSAGDQAMADAFIKKGYTVPDSMVDERVADMVHKTFNDDHAAFVRAIEAQGFTEVSYRQAEREKIMVQAVRSMMKKEGVESPSQISAAPKPTPRA